MPERRPDRGILDTSVVIDPELLDIASLPLEVAVTAITMAELAAAPTPMSGPADRIVCGAPRPPSTSAGSLRGSRPSPLRSSLPTTALPSRR